MKLNQIVICDSEAGYAERLADYLRGKEVYGQEIKAFTNVTQFFEREVQTVIGQLLIEDRLYQELLQENKLKQLNINKILLLTKDRNACTGAVEKTVYKYQPGYGIFCRLFEEQKEIPAFGAVLTGQCKAKIISIYSPVKRTLKTAFAITLGQLLAEKEQVLYINLESCSGLTKLLSLQAEKNLADLAYEFSIDGRIPASLHSYTQTAEGLFVLSPIESISEMQCIAEESWVALLLEIAQTGAFQTVILDMGDAVCGIMEILHLCDRIYMPYRSDYISMAKLDAFTASFGKHAGAASLQERIHRLEFPYFEDLEEGFSNLKYSGLGAYVRKLLLSEEP